MIFTHEDVKKFEIATECHICNKEFVRIHPHCHNKGETTCEHCVDKPDVIVRDHCHIHGHLRGAAHQHSNLNYRVDPKKWKLPIFLHNLPGYDGHLLIQAAKERYGNIRVIPNNMERYAAFSIVQIQLLDSFQFTMKSLDNLFETMNEEDFKYMRQLFPDDEKIYLMRRKGVFPYGFFDNILRLLYTTFPSRDAFFNTMNNQECSMDDYLHAKLIWNRCN